MPACSTGIQCLEHLRLRPYEVDDLEIVAEYPVDGSLMKRTGFWAHVKPDGRTITQTLDGWEKRKDRFYVTPTLVVHEAVVGNVADMVIVGVNLAEDIGLLARIENVIHAGRVFEVEQLLKEAAEWAAEDRPEEDEATH
jgi:hypothetical protein